MLIQSISKQPMSFLKSTIYLSFRKKKENNEKYPSLTNAFLSSYQDGKIKHTRANNVMAEINQAIHEARKISLARRAKLGLAETTKNNKYDFTQTIKLNFIGEKLQNMVKAKARVGFEVFDNYKNSSCFRDITIASYCS